MKDSDTSGGDADSDPRCEACFDGDDPAFKCEAGQVDCGRVYATSGYGGASGLCGEDEAASPEDCPELAAQNAAAMTCLFDFLSAGQTGTVAWENDNLVVFDERSFYFRNDGTVFDVDRGVDDGGTSWTAQQLRSAPMQEILACADEPDGLSQWGCVVAAIEAADLEATCVEEGYDFNFE